jgi:hypothetical protein
VVAELREQKKPDERMSGFPSLTRGLFVLFELAGPSSMIQPLAIHAYNPKSNMLLVPSVPQEPELSLHEEYSS